MDSIEFADLVTHMHTDSDDPTKRGKLRELLTDLRYGYGQLDNIYFNKEGVHCLRKRKTGEDPASKRHYYTIKYGKALRLMMSEATSAMFTDHDIEELVNQVKAALDDTATVTIVEAGEIAYWYHQQRYATRGRLGSLGTSCMRYARINPYVRKFYDTIGNAASLMIATNTQNELIGRAVIWNGPDGQRYHEYPYAGDSTRTLIQNECLKLNILPMRIVDTHLAIPIEHPEIPLLAGLSMDSMRYLDLEEMTIQNYHPGDHNALYFSSLEGGFSWKSSERDYPVNIQDPRTTHYWPGFENVPVTRRPRLRGSDGRFISEYGPR